MNSRFFICGLHHLAKKLQGLLIKKGLDSGRIEVPNPLIQLDKAANKNPLL